MCRSVTHFWLVLTCLTWHFTFLPQFFTLYYPFGGKKTCSILLCYSFYTFVSSLLLNMFFQSLSWIVPIYLLLMDPFELLSYYWSNNIQERLNLSSCNVVPQAKLSRTRKLFSIILHLKNTLSIQKYLSVLFPLYIFAY